MTASWPSENSNIGDFSSAPPPTKDNIKFLQSKLTDVKAFASISNVLLGGVPASDLFQFKVNQNIKTNYGGLQSAFPDNDEAIYVNVAISTIKENAIAATKFAAISPGLSLKESITNIYNSVVPAARQNVDGLAYLVRDEAIQFYKDAAQARGLNGDFGAAAVAFGALMNILVESKVGTGDAANDLARTLMDGAWNLPDQSLGLLPLETVDGAAYDGDDASAFAAPLSPPPAPHSYGDFLI